MIGGTGHIALPTANHDYARLVTGTRSREHVGAAFAFLMTWPTLPTIYYGDEIGMRYIPDLPDKEGSMLAPLNNRTGSRTPMQWDASPNAGFSTAPADQLYLPIDPDPARPTVAAQRDDEDSLLHLVRRLIALRRATPALGSAAPVEVLHSGYPFVYTRGGTHLVVVNPRRAPATATLPAGLVGDGVRALEVHGARLAETRGEDRRLRVRDLRPVGAAPARARNAELDRVARRDAGIASDSMDLAAAQKLWEPIPGLAQHRQLRPAAEAGVGRPAGGARRLAGRPHVVGAVGRVDRSGPGRRTRG